MTTSRVRRIAAAAVVLALAAVGLVAAPAQAATVSVTGTVTLAVTGGPAGVGDVRIMLIRDRTTVEVTQTGADGTFSLDVEPGDGYSILLRTQRSDTLSLWSDGRPTAPQGTTGTGALPMSITESLVIERTLPAAGRVTGQVSLGGVPGGAGVELTAKYCSDAECSRGSAGGEPVPIGEDGRYELTGLIYGWYFFEAWYEDRSYLPVRESEVTPLNVTTTGPNVVTRDFDLVRSGTLRGTVLFSDGRVPYFGQVELWERTSSGDVRIREIGGGPFQVVGISPGTHTYFLRSAGAYPYVEREFTVTIGPEYSFTRNFVMQPAGPPYAAIGDNNTFGGTVYLGSTATKAGEWDAKVTLYRDAAGRSPITFGSAVTDENGNFVITGIQPGPVYARVHYSGTGPYETDRVETTTINWVVNPLYSPTLAVAYRYRGHVELSSDGTPSGGAAGAGEVEVRLRSPGNSQPLQTTFTDAAGDYAFDRVAYATAPSTYLEFVYHGSGSVPTWYDTGDGIGSREASAAVTTPLTQDLTRDVVIAAGSGISGTILGSDGEPVDEAPVTVTVTAFEPGPGGEAVSSSTAVVDASGRYAVRGLDSDYVYEVSWTASGFSFGRNGGGDLRYSRGFVQVDPFEMTDGVDGTLYREARIELTVQRGSDIPPFTETPARATLLTYDDLTDEWRETTATAVDASGRIEFGDLHPGRYAVRAVYAGPAGVNSIVSAPVEIFEEQTSRDSIQLHGPGNSNNIDAQFTAFGGASGLLGARIAGSGGVVAGGATGDFVRGSLFTSASGTWAVWKGGILETYRLAGGPAGDYGWPVAEQVCDDDGCSQQFQHGTIAPTPMSLVAPPAVTGAVRVGVAVTVSAGAYSPTATNFAYQWQRDGVDIVGSTSAVYVPTVADFGHSIRATVVAWSTGRIPVTTTTAAVVVSAGDLAAAPAPTVTGSVKVGSTLTVKPGSWPAGTAFRYQWSANGVPLADASLATLVVPPAAVGKRITVTVTGTVPGYLPLGKTSAPTAAVAATNFTASPSPRIVGVPQVGLPLTVDTGTWTPGATFRYQWYVNGTAIKNATNATFTPTGSQVGKRLTVKVAGSSTGYVSVARTSARSAAIKPGVWNASPLPEIVGTPQVGLVLTATTPGWQSAARFSYQWYADGAAISKATGSTFVPTAGQLGKTITVRITTTAVGYPKVARASAPTVAVAVGVFSGTPTPTITGTARFGDTLKAVTAAWAPSATLRYQWLADGVPVPKATASSFTLSTAQLGAQISVVVTGTRSGFTPVSRESLPTAAVAERPFTTTVVPKVSGSARVGSLLTATRGTWSPDGPYTYHWYADGVVIAGATTSKFTPTVDQVGRRITVGVTAQRAGYLTTERLSTPTASVAP